MRKLYALLAAILCFSASSFSQSGIFESYAILDINGGGNTYYDMQATTANPDFQGASLGTFNSSNSLVVKGGQNKTFKCAPCDITNGNFYYRVWLTSAGPSGSFTNISESFLANLGTGCGGNDQSWEGTSGATNILTGLTPGNYTLEVYSAADYQGCGTGTNFSNNGGANYRATFTFCGPTSGPLPAGNYAIPGCFPTVAAAVTYINTNGVSGTGNVQFDVAAGYTETAPAGGFAITATGTSTLGIKFVKSGSGANPTFTAPTPQASGALNDAIFKLIGADYITIDGFTLQENAANTTTTTASNNMTEWGVALLYASTTNGAQNNTIQNNTITLNRTYTNTWGVYSNVRHSATVIATTADITNNTTAPNSGNKVYSNTISNVNMGIAFIGSGTAANQDIGNDVGGAIAGTGNTITNWGGAAAASGYISNSGTSYCIFMNHQVGDNVSNNTITSATISGTAVTLRGIFKDYTTAGATLVGTTNITNNTVTITDNFTSGTLENIRTQGTVAATSTINVNGNTILNTSVGGASSSTTIVCLVNSSAPGTLSMSNNIIRGITSTATTGGFTGISNTGAVVTTCNINNNQVGNASGGAITFSAATSGTVLGVSSSGGASTCTTSLSGNDIRGIVHSVAASSTHTYYRSTAAVSSNTIGNNTLTNLNVNTTGTTLFIDHGYSIPATGQLIINNNSIVTAYNRGGASGSVTLTTSNSTSGTGSVNNYTNNNFSNITVAGTTTITGFNNTDGGTGSTKQVNGNTFNNWTAGTGAINTMNFTYWNGVSSLSNNTITNITGQGNITGVTMGSTSNAATSIAVSGNTITNLTSTGTGGSVTGIVCSNTSTLINISGNTVSTLSSTGASSVTGINITGAATTNVFKNRICDLSGSNASSTVSGIQVTSGTTVTVYNNRIGDLRTPAANAANPLNGINITGGTTVNAYFNTVYLSATSSGALFGSSAVSASTTPTVTLRNNIFVNNSTTNGAAFTAAYRRSTTTLTSYGATSNNNLFYAGTPGVTNVIYYDGTNNDQTLAAYKSRVASRDASSVTENPPFLSTTCGNASFLKIDPAIATQVESGAATIAGFPDDFDGDTRNVSTPDIGADEGAFTLADFIPPTIAYTPLSFTCDGSVNRTLTTTITDASGVPQSGAGLPVLYWRINAGAYTAATGTWVSGNTYTFSFGAGAVAGDVVSYYIVAQDNAGTPNVGSFPSGGAAGFTANPPAAATPPTTPSSYTINNALNGTYTVGAAGAFPTLTAAINAYNTSCLTGPVVFSLIDAAYTTTSDTIRINPDASAVNTLTIKPAIAGVTVTGNSTTATLVILGADYINIDGSTGSTANTICPPSAASRDLTIVNSNTGTTSAVIWLTPSGTDGASNNTIMNCNINGNSATTTLIAVGSGGAIGSASTAANNNNKYINNNVSKAVFGIASFGTSAAVKNSGTVISQNLANTAAPNNLSRGGIFSGFEDGVIISGNNVSNISGTTTNYAFGISAGLLNTTTTTTTGSEVTNATITKNIVGSVRAASTYGVSGIAVASAATGTTLVANNMIADAFANGTLSDIGAGIYIGGGAATTNIYYNTVQMAGTLTGGSYYNFGIAINGVNPIVDLKNNIVTNTGSNGANNNRALGLAYSTFTNLTSDYNDLFVSGTSSAVVQTGTLSNSSFTSYTTVTGAGSWNAASGKDANSRNVAPVFVSATDLHLNVGLNPLLNGAGTPVSVTDDIDCALRDAATPDMGADEFAPPTCSTATGGTASGSTSACVSYTGNITATGYSIGTGSTYQWVSATNPAGPWTAIGGATNPASYTISPAVTVTTYYKLAVACATNASVDSSTMVTITINPKPTVPVTPGGPITLCAPATQVLDGSGTNAASPAYQWLNNNIPIGAATSATYTVSASGSYRVRVVDGVTSCFDTSVAVVVTINPQPSAVTITPASPTICAGNVQRLTAGGGTVNTISSTIGNGSGFTSATGEQTAFCNRRVNYVGQTIYTAAELSAAGIVAGNITSLAYNISSNGDATTNANFTVRIGNVGVQSTFSGTAFLPNGGFTTVYGPATYTHAAPGWQTITFSTPYVWDGTSNIVIDVRHDGIDAINNAQTNFTTTAGNASLYGYNTPAAGTLSTTRLNIQLGYQAPAPITWAPTTGLFLDSAATIAYAGGNEDTLYASPAATQVYTATATSGAGCSNTGNVTVTVTPPSSSNGLAGTPTPGATAQWSETHIVANGQNYVEAATCDLINKVVPAGASPVSGSIFSAVRVDTGANKMGSGELYAARFYAIEPATAPSTSTARVTLYYLQSEFDNYNLKAVDSAKYALPTGPGDALGISRLVIRQFHGTPTGGYLPGNYAGANEILDPADADVVWNATASRWEVTVPVSSFSGFWLTSVDFIVPVRLLNIRGEVTGNTNTIHWTTSQEQNNRKFIIERSTDGRNFVSIGETASRALNGTSSTPLSYSFVDAAPVNGKAYYRLQMVSMNGGTEQSPVVTLLRGKGNFEIVDVRPNPTTGTIYFNVIGSNSAITVVVRSLEGKEMARTSLSQSNAFSLNIGGLANGMYILEATDRNGAKATYKIVKQ